MSLQIIIDDMPDLNDPLKQWVVAGVKCRGIERVARCNNFDTALLSAISLAREVYDECMKLDGQPA